MTARLNAVSRSRTEQRCLKCGEPIPKGSPYVWYKFRFGGKQVFHDIARCRPNAADLESNAKIAAHRRIESAIDDARSALETDYDTIAAQTALDAAASDAREIADELETTYDAWQGTNLANSYMSERYGEMRDEFNSFADDCETLSQSVSNLDVPEEPGSEPVEPDPSDYDFGTKDADYLADYEAWQACKPAYDAFVEDCERLAGELPDVPELELPAAPRMRRR